MKLHLLEALIAAFLEAQIKSNATDWYFPHTIVSHFHSTWVSPSDLVLKDRYDRALKSEISQSWWKGVHYRPREIMLKLIEADSELAGIAFKDLANETASLDGRLYRFNYYADELLQILRKNELRVIDTHHHQDARIVSLYLAGFYPEKYTLYTGLSDFQLFCKTVGSPDIPQVDDLVRYSKIANIIFTFCNRNPLFEELKSIRKEITHRISFLPFQVTYEIMASVDKSGLR